MRAATAIFVFVLMLSLQTSATAADACRAYRAELARLGHSGFHQQAVRAAQLYQYRRSANCAGGFFGFRPPQCDAIDQQIGALRASAGSEDRSRERRRELHGLIAKYCSEPADESSAPAEGSASEESVPGGPQLICVRRCDGGYFPMDWPGKDDADPDQLCQALCPGTAATAYSKPPGDDGLQDATSVRANVAYSSLPNAFKFQKEIVPACNCKSKGVSWSQSLMKAEELLPDYKGDVVVTSKLADELSRPHGNVSRLLAKWGRLSPGIAQAKHHTIRLAYRHSRHNKETDFGTSDTGISYGGPVSSYTAPSSFGPFRQ
jgi:hypothetical protein